jgi:hypothetical protein
MADLCTINLNAESMKKKTANLHPPINILGYPTCPKGEGVSIKINEKKKIKSKNASEIEHSADAEWENEPGSIDDFFE